MKPMYQSVRDGEVARTVQVSPSTLLDVDAAGQLIGTESLSGDLKAAYVEALTAVKF